MKDDLLWMYAGYILKVVMEGGVFLFVSSCVIMVDQCYGEESCWRGLVDFFRVCRPCPADQFRLPASEIGVKVTCAEQMEEGRIDKH